jgi:hypothetical protein
MIEERRLLWSETGVNGRIDREKVVCIIWIKFFSKKTAVNPKIGSDSRLVYQRYHTLEMAHDARPRK